MLLVPSWSNRAALLVPSHVSLFTSTQSIKEKSLNKAKMFCHKHIIESSFVVSKYHKGVKQVQTAYMLLLNSQNAVIASAVTN